MLTAQLSDCPAVTTDQNPRYFIDDAFDADTDSDWWLDLGVVDLPNVPSV